MPNEFPVATSTVYHTAPSSSSIPSIASITPSLTSKSGSNSVASTEATVSVEFLYTTSMNQLDSSGYLTRALYYLHKRMLEVSLHPRLYHNQPWCLQISPSTPPLGDDDDEGIIAPENSLEEDEILSVLEEVNQVSSMEEDPVLHNLCTTLLSTEYITPPTPPTGATPCDTPPEFEAPVFTEHDEFACRVARMILSSDEVELDGRAVEELEIELECRGAWVSGSCPCGKGGSKKSLLEEMEICASKTPREAKQARRRARNSSRGVALDATEVC